MAETFADLGLRTELVDAADSAGYDAPSPIQAAAVPVLRRGGNAVLNASPGAGVVAAYGLGLLDRLAEASTGAAVEPGRPRLLVLAPATSVADRIAVSLARFGRATDFGVTALAPGWPGEAAAAAVAVAVTDAALAAVQTSRLKLDAIEAVVVDGVAEHFELGAGDSLETLLSSVPSESQRVAVSAAFPEQVERFIEAYVRRALHIPPRRAADDKAARDAEKRAGGGTLGYTVVPDDERTEAAAVLLQVRDDAHDGAVALFCRHADRATPLADALALRGFAARADATENEPGRVVVGDEAVGADAVPADALTISYDVPFDADALERRHGGGGHVIVAPRELPHLRRIAARAGFQMRATTLPAPERAVGGLDSFRERLRRAVHDEDLAAQWLVLEPLLDEFSAAELAAAASALLRRRAPAGGAEQAAPARAPTRRPQPSATSTAAAAPTGPAPPAFVRLFMSIGRRDDAGPGDIVGAITGETKASGDQVGRIEIMDTFSIVEVANEVAEDVIGTMNGITLKGRSLRVDYDRKASRGGGGRGGRGGSGGGRGG